MRTSICSPESPAPKWEPWRPPPSLGGVPTEKQILFAANLRAAAPPSTQQRPLADKGAMSPLERRLQASRDSSAPARMEAALPPPRPAWPAWPPLPPPAVRKARTKRRRGRARTRKTAAAGTDTAMDELDRLFDDPMDEEDVL